MFSPEELATEVQKQINQGNITLPDNKKIGLITHGDTDGKSVATILVYKPDNDWTVEAVGGYSEVSGWNAGFNVEWFK